MSSDVENNPWLDRLGIAAPDAGSSRWTRFGLRSNPFPSRAHPIWEVFYDQEVVRKRFYDDLGVLFRDGTSRTLLFTGGNRVGKTHLMQHHRLSLPAQLQARGILLPTAVATAQDCDIWAVYQTLLVELDAFLRETRNAGLFDDLDVWTRRADFAEARQSLEDELSPGDFRVGLLRLLDQAGRPHHAERARLLLQWLRGERFRSARRAEIGVTDLVEPVSQMVDALRGLFVFLRVWGEHLHDDGQGWKLPGVLLFLDEFELVFSYRRDKRHGFLQALRAMVDACPRGLFLCVGLATGTGVETAQLEFDYPALFSRLKGAREIPALVQIGNVLDAIGYTRAFIDHGRKRADTVSQRADELISDRDIDRIFRDLAGASSVPQGDFFDRLHVEAEQRAAAAIA